MKERIKQVRKDFKISQEKMAASLNLSRTFIAQVEIGISRFSDRTIADFCRIYRVNEDWLRSGEGEPYVNRTRNQQIAEFINNVMESDDNEFKKSLIVALSKLDENQWQLLADIAENVTSK